MNIAFITCFYKTIFFKAIADNLMNLGYNVYWISTSNKWSRWLINQGVNRQDIIVLRRDFANLWQVSEKDLIYLLDKFERETKENIKTIFYMDRVVSKWEWSEARKYIIYLITNIEYFINKNNIKVIFGEATAIHEVLSAIICKQKNIHFLCPHTLRIPSNRFAFFKGYLQSDFHVIKASEEDYQYINEALTVISKVVNEGMRPNYWHWSNSKPKYNLSMISTIFSKTIEALTESKTDATVKPLFYHFKYEKKFLKPVRYLLANKMSIFEEPKEEKYVLYTLHKQPESSLDVLGVKYQNQIELIKTIAMNLPHNVVLYVKEHANCLGDRPIVELKRIKQIPGVKLINPFVDIHKLIKRSELVITVSGTVAFEAGLHNKRAVTLSKMFFNSLSSVTYLDNINMIANYIQGKCSKSNKENKEDVLALAHMLANSFEGIISDPKSAPICMSESNIQAVSQGFIEVLKYLYKNNGEA
ncbi:UDP-N-acetylglucosamine 2-epimerase [Desulfallas sp. Bu1-1]|uniref:capsular polysaccharide export protein, LipB/KpsS family n=1 Tax=Desulfallas sp. Bu1-1 TaxID=2787620 RepID=UPI00189EE201|nr:UDP-N-acetylglucosamine 2-epimerase [Desulfallas sp. Bu1-1]MBF7081591.1 UDP-N-acetylglucosamine 2-epimerase [Desulfallas sp. Bu1-1]